MKNSFLFLLQIFILTNILTEILCGDKSRPSTEINANLGTRKKPETITATKNANLGTGKMHETDGTSKMPKHGKPVSNRMAAKSTTIKNNNEAAGPSQQSKQPAANITPQQKGPMQNSKKQPPNELFGKKQRSTPEEIKAGKQPAMELMPCYRGIGKKTMPTIAQRNATMLKRGDSLTRSADFEDPILANVKQSQMLIRQKSKGTMDLEMDEFLKLHKQIQGPRQKLVRMEREKMIKEATEKAKVDRRNRMLEREKMWSMKKAGVAAHQPASPAIRGRTQQQQQQKLQPDKKPEKMLKQQNKTQNFSAPSTSKQIVNRRLLIGPNKPRTGNKIGTTKHGIHSAEIMTSSSESNVPKSENLGSSEMETAEEAAQTYLNNLRVDLNKIPSMKIPFLEPIIEKYVDEYKKSRQLFAECMQKILRKSKNPNQTVKIIEFKKTIEKEMNDLLKHTDLPPDQLIDLLNTREWLLSMKKDIEYMERILTGRENNDNI
uniref:Secretory protein 5D06 n=1 Tax=Heterodera glycines TaxID=51029 RepID=Q8ITI7_HETGL|nr:secretory protein 5D06 [Heterodera glycines]QLK97567.1 secretory protein 5D06 [Heterodera glycines]